MQGMKEMQVWSSGWEGPLEEGIAIHSGILVWRIPWTEEPGGLQSVGSQRAGHDWSDLAHTKQLSLLLGIASEMVILGDFALKQVFSVSDLIQPEHGTWSVLSQSHSSLGLWMVKRAGTNIQRWFPTHWSDTSMRRCHGLVAYLPSESCPFVVQFFSFLEILWVPSILPVNPF